MSMRLYDTARQAVVPFVPAGETALIYTCGITPYDATHLGHAATYLAYDVLQRRLPGRLHMPTDPEGVDMIERDTRMHDQPARSELGIEPVPFDQSLRDTLQWLADSGRLAARYAPRAPEAVAQG